jgi:hypothetical protein
MLNPNVNINMKGSPLCVPTKCFLPSS